MVIEEEEQEREKWMKGVEGLLAEKGWGEVTIWEHGVLVNTIRFDTGDYVICSVLLANFHDTLYLFASLSNGEVIVVPAHSKDPRDIRRAPLGREMGTLIKNPWTERSFDDDESDNGDRNAKTKKDDIVLFLGDHPVIISLTADGSLKCTNIAIDGIISLCAFRGMVLFLHKTQGLIAGQIDTTGQQITIESTPIGKSPRKIMPLEGWLCCLNENKSQSFLTLFDPETMKPHDEYAFPNNEMAASLTTIVFGDDNVTYCAVGTGVDQKVAALEGKEESKYPLGHIYLFRLLDNKLYLSRCLNVNGVVYALHPCEAGLLAGVDARVILYKTAELKQCCEYFGHVATLTLDAIGNRVLAGDLVRSLTLLEYRDDGFHEVAKDYSQLWIVQAMMVDRNNFLVADAFGNLIFFTLRDCTGPTGQKDLRIERCGECSVGSMVNVLMRGSLLMKIPEQQKSYSYTSVIKESKTKEGFALPELFDTILFGTVSGILGSVAILKQDLYKFLLNLQNYMPKEKLTLGGFDFTKFRSSKNEYYPKKFANFIDGDLILKFFNLSKEKKAEISTKLEMPVSDILRILERLQRSIL